MPRKEYLQKKRRVEAEESATKCQKLTQFSSKGTGNFNKEKSKDKDEQLSESPPSSINDTDGIDSQVAGKVKSAASYQGYILDVNKVQEKVGKDSISVYHEKIAHASDSYPSDRYAVNLRKMLRNTNVMVLFILLME